MRIAGIQTCSFVDYPGRLAATIFTPRCNMNCFYCHNRALIRGNALMALIPPETTLAWLDRRKGLLDAVVVTGGEPTLQPDLAGFIERVRAKGFLVKLDTNGMRPRVLASLLDAGLLDYVAMDVKAPPEKYAAICGVPVDPTAIDTSIRALMNGRVDYEFRTTVVPQLDEADVIAIAEWVRGARKLVLQQYRPPQEDIADPRLAVPPHESDWPWRILDQLETRVESCETRGFDRAAKALATTAA